MPVVEMKLSETPFSGDRQKRRHRYIVRTVDMTDEELYSWLLATEAWFPAGLQVERPTGELVTEGRPLLPSWDQRDLDDVTINLRRDCDPEFWEVEAIYDFAAGGGGQSLLNTPESDETITVSYEFTPAQARYYTSLKTRNTLPATGAGLAPDTFNAINVQADGTVDGTDVPSAPSEISLSITKPFSFFTQAKIVELARKVSRGYVNNNTFKLGGFEFAEGEVRLQALSGKINTTNGDSNIDVRFGILENVNDRQVDGIDGPITTNPLGGPLFGWHYLWVKYGRGSQNGKETPKPVGAYVEQLFPETDLNALFS